MTSQKVNLPCTGIASFCKFPICYDLNDLEADVAILGVPWDSGTGFRPGSRMGPRAIREYSVRYAFFERGVNVGGYFDLDLKRRFLENTSFADCGDVDVLYLNVEETFNRIMESTKKIVSKNSLPVVIGGDHSITYPVVEGFADIGRQLNLIHFDAHLDYNDDIFGVRLANGSPIKRCSELSFINEIVSIGARGVRTNEAAYKDALSRGNTIISAQEVVFGDINEVVAKIPPGDAYVTIDIDVLDPPIAPGTCSPEINGLSYWDLKGILSGIADRCNVVGIDLVEVNPMVDPTGLTASVATQTLLEFIARIFN